MLRSPGPYTGVRRAADSARWSVRGWRLFCSAPPAPRSLGASRCLLLTLASWQHLTVGSGMFPSLPTAERELYCGAIPALGCAVFHCHCASPVPALAVSPLLCSGSCDRRGGCNMGAPSCTRIARGGGGSAAAGAAPRPGLAPPGCWEQRRWSVHGRCMLGAAAGGQSLVAARRDVGTVLPREQGSGWKIPQNPAVLTSGKNCWAVAKEVQLLSAASYWDQKRGGTPNLHFSRLRLLEPCSSAAQLWTLPPHLAGQP